MPTQNDDVSSNGTPKPKVGLGSRRSLGTLGAAIKQENTDAPGIIAKGNRLGSIRGGRSLNPNAPQPTLSVAPTKKFAPTAPIRRKKVDPADNTSSSTIRPKPRLRPNTQRTRGHNANDAAATGPFALGPSNNSGEKQLQEGSTQATVIGIPSADGTGIVGNYSSKSERMITKSSRNAVNTERMSVNESELDNEGEYKDVLDGISGFDNEDEWAPVTILENNTLEVKDEIMIDSSIDDKFAVKTEEENKAISNTEAVLLGSTYKSDNQGQDKMDKIGEFIIFQFPQVLPVFKQEKEDEPKIIEPLEVNIPQTTNTAIPLKNRVGTTIKIGQAIKKETAIDENSEEKALDEQNPENGGIKSNNLGTTSSACSRDVPSGKVGKLRVHKSGKITLQLGGITFDVSKGTSSTCMQKVVGLDTNEGNLCILGDIQRKFIVSPDLGNI